MLISGAPPWRSRAPDWLFRRAFDLVMSYCRIAQVVNPRQTLKTMKLNPIQAAAAALVVLASAAAAYELKPHQLMAQANASIELETATPTQFGAWKEVPGVGLVAPSDPEGYAQADENSSKVYTKELGRAYADPDGHLIMLMVAYGPVQNYRLKAHRPEICYTANGFRVSEKFGSKIAYGNGQSVSVTRL